jgi:hypothetical protein
VERLVANLVENAAVAAADGGEAAVQRAKVVASSSP